MSQFYYGGTQILLQMHTLKIHQAWPAPANGRPDERKE